MARSQPYAKPLHYSWRKRLFGFLACLILFALPVVQIPSAQAKGENPYDLIAAVNQLRIANGLPPYQINGALMASAQAHSEYQAAIDSVTHYGPGGNRARDRATAAGYGGGTTIYVSENIAGGMSFNIQSVVQMWQGDDLHLNTMLGASYTDIGAGIASSGSRTYYTIDVGYIAGSPGPGTGISPTQSGGSPPTATTPQATVVVFNPVQVAKPNEDGSVIHEVQAGQSLWSIAAVYGIELSKLLETNGLGNNAYIYPGQKLIIKSPDNDKPEETRQARKTAKAQASQEATTEAVIQKATQPPQPDPTATLQVQPTSAQGINNPPNMDPLLIAIGGLVLGGTALIILGNLLRRNGG